MADRGVINGGTTENLAGFSGLRADGVNGVVTRRPWETAQPKTFYALLDALCVCLNTLITFELRFRSNAAPWPGPRWTFTPTSVSLAPHLGFLLLYTTLIVLFCQSQELYGRVRGRSTLDEIFAVVKVVLSATLLLAAFIYLFGEKSISWLAVGFSGLLNTVALTGWRLLRDEFVRRRVADGWGARNALIVGAGRIGRTLGRYLTENKQLGYIVSGFLDERNGDPLVLGEPAELATIARAHFVQEVFITIPPRQDLIASAILEARRLRLAVNLVPDFCDGLGWHVPIRYVGYFPVMELHREPVPVVGLVIKRAMDIVLSTLGLFLGLPLMAAIALAVKLDSPGPALYRSCRVGRKGQKFVCYKFRTMVPNADELKQNLNHLNERQGPLFKISNDPRLTRLGGFVRKYSLDELPQLFNVLKGEMSLVGPRPPLPEECAEYKLEHLRRLDVKPGITGLWQVGARRHPAFEKALALDLEYIEKWSLRLDFKILLKTLPAVLSGSGA